MHTNCFYKNVGTTIIKADTTTTATTIINIFSFFVVLNKSYLAILI